QSSLAWKIVDASDFNKDGKRDLLWRKTNGALAVWFMDQTNRIGTALLRHGNPFPTSWRFIGTGDFNADSNEDLLWHNTDRRLATTFLDTTNILGSSFLREGHHTGLGWRPVTSHDFDQDGHSDILFQHDDGHLAWWKMNGINFSSSTLLRNGKSAGPGWRAVGLSDFNNDGHKDILLQNSDGRLAAWLMNQTNFLNTVILRDGPAHNSGWRIVVVR
ncbi:MAG: FG-GAP repeat domain-containing protein, partial [Limisphaerales bacterium]